MSTRKFRFGIEPLVTKDLPTAFAICKEIENVEYCVLPLVHPRLRRYGPRTTATRGERSGSPLTRSDVLLTPQQWSTNVVGRMSRWIDLDPPDVEERIAAEAAFAEELNWALHLGMTRIILPTCLSGRRRTTLENYARCVNDATTANAARNSHLQFWVEVSLSGDGDGDEEEENDDDDVWNAWNEFRIMCNHASNLYIVLRLGTDLPARANWARWFGEPVRAVMIPTTAFINNKAGYPTLGKAHQAIVLSLFERGMQCILTGRARHPNGHLTYEMYLRHITSTKASPVTEQDELEFPFYDYLQVPLQPLGDNLESNVYSVFEQDETKYRLYESACHEALKTLNLVKKPSTSTASFLTCMVVGAGRGPLVKALLRAAETAGIEVRVFAVEKNPNAVVTLLNAKRTLPDWGDRVEVVASDMRRWTPPCPADLVVSELLGSWGDNELSPECLEGILARHLARPHGISVPTSYTSFLAPLSSHKLWTDVRNLGMGGEFAAAAVGMGANPWRSFETLYVVKIFNAYLPCGGEFQPVFEFRHDQASLGDPDSVPDEREPSHHDRLRREMAFTFEADAEVHGFAGYFDCVLYGDVRMSILPPRHSPGMFSWFPAFIPLREPVRVGKGEVLKATFWRLSDLGRRKVWYEWVVRAGGYYVSPIHNPNGRSYHVDL